jgi:tRNA (guanine37-N1)-methyltransferase
MRIDVVTIFPGYLAALREALLGRAIEAGLISVAVHDLRDWTHDVHKAVDDAPYGGGPGMVMRPAIWGAALDDVCAPPEEALADRGTADRGVADRDRADRGVVVPRLVVPTPAGRPFTQAVAREYAAQPWLVFACGRYEGIDQRVFEDASRRMVVDEVSIGDYVLVGGEVAVLAMVEAVARLLPGVLGNPDSAAQDSFSDGLLEGPAYTRPERWRDLAVPEVLRGGDHAAIARWRRDQSLARTAARRPDLIAALPPDALQPRDRELLERLGTEGE